MSNSFKQKSIADFIDIVSSSSPTPGGGTVAAFGGALSTALVIMVANLTIGKEGYESLDKRMQEILGKVKKQQKELLELADQDSKAFDEVVKSYKMPKDNPDRKEIIQLSLKKAVEVPLRVAKICSEVIIIAEELVKTGNKNAFSDAKSAQYFAIAAKKSAIENVKINLDGIRDEEWKKSMVITEDDAR